jgi:hypothetical protein
LGSKPILVEPVEEHLTSDAGLPPIRQFDEQIGLTAQFAAALKGLRYGPFVEHSFAEMARMRIYGILAGYADQNDHDQLPQAAYADRGESENRNKEIKCGLEADRLSDHRYLANLFRLYLHAAALNLLVRLRNQSSLKNTP